MEEKSTKSIEFGKKVNRIKASHQPELHSGKGGQKKTGFQVNREEKLIRRIWNV